MNGDLPKPRKTRGHGFKSASPASIPEAEIAACRLRAPGSEPELEDDESSARGWAVDDALSGEDEAWPDSDRS